MRKRIGRNKKNLLRGDEYNYEKSKIALLN